MGLENVPFSPRYIVHWREFVVDATVEDTDQTVKNGSELLDRGVY